MRKIEHTEGKDLGCFERTLKAFLAINLYKQEVASEGVKTSFFMNGPNKIEFLEATNLIVPLLSF
jgi:methylmalonyl-CoA/ethylmalonyl-CoA epimerase